MEAILAERSSLAREAPAARKGGSSAWATRSNRRFNAASAIASMVSRFSSAKVSGLTSKGAIQSRLNEGETPGWTITLAVSPRLAGPPRSGVGVSGPTGFQSEKRALISASMTAGSKSPTAIRVARSGGNWRGRRCGSAPAWRS